MSCWGRSRSRSRSWGCSRSRLLNLQGFRRSLNGGKSECRDHDPSTEEIDWHCSIFDCWVKQKNAENVEYIVSVIGKGEGVHNSVEVNHGKHKRDHDQGRLELGIFPLFRREAKVQIFREWLKGENVDQGKDEEGP